MDDKAKIENCYCQMYCGMIDKDCELLSGILDQSFVLVHMTGMRQSKEEFIQAVKNDTLNYFSANHQHMDIEIQGSRAKLTGQSIVNAEVFGGGRHTWRLRLQLELFRNTGTWRITGARASIY